MITSSDDFHKLATMADTAEECLQSLRFGSHAALMLLLKLKYGITADRTQSIKEARRLCSEFVTAQSVEEDEE